MGLSRRQFTKEFKLAAVRRLEQGVSIAEPVWGQSHDSRLLVNLDSVSDTSFGDS